MEGKLKLILKQLKLHEGTISMILGAVVILVSATLLYTYFNEVQQEAGISEEAASDQAEFGQLLSGDFPQEYTVKTGEHLWDIAERFYGTGFVWTEIAKANDIANPDSVVPGQSILLPKIRSTQITDKQIADAGSSLAISQESYTVSKGDTLWIIAVRAYQDGYQWPKILEANRDKLSNPDAIEEGMVLSLPRYDWLK